MKRFYKEIETESEFFMPYAESKFVKVLLTVEKGDELNQAGYEEGETFEVPEVCILIDVEEPFIVKEDTKIIENYIKSLIDR